MLSATALSSFPGTNHPHTHTHKAAGCPDLSYLPPTGTCCRCNRTFTSSCCRGQRSSTTTRTATSQLAACCDCSPTTSRSPGVKTKPAVSNHSKVVSNGRSLQGPYSWQQHDVAVVSQKDPSFTSGISGKSAFCDIIKGNVT